ncbi:MAG: 3-phosphoshikimate 1-carboxyvinyltransferase [Candidatus Adiutrix sp.]|jgi:3-phosphoshikimate 1-carboxyvinyltransferase|nr:3-phosphoshikimate 1-carboxyvinyltransferase [Candidatus Adiutrix sp.]
MALRGELIPPGDKSVSHRLVLMALLAEGEMSVTGLGDCEDVKTSLAIFRSLGGSALGGPPNLTIKGLGGRLNIDPDREVELDCANSGTTMRLLAGLLAGLPGRFLLDGDIQLRRRPMERLADPLRQMGARIETTNGLAPIAIQGGGLHGIDYQNQEGSAQLKGAVILATLSASSPSRVTEPIPTRDHTERLVSYFGGRVTTTGATIEASPGSLTLPADFHTPGDPSSAAFFLVGAALIPESRVTARQILLSSTRIGFLKVLDRMGASIAITLGKDRPETSGDVTVEYNGRLTATEVTKEEVPSLIDEIPMLALAAALAEGETVFRQVRELRLKETDRLTAIKHQLGALGVKVRVEGDDLFVTGLTKLTLPETLDSGHDHRLAMTLHLALKAARASVPILGDESMAISYPAFQADLARLDEGQA